MTKHLSLAGAAALVALLPVAAGAGPSETPLHRFNGPGGDDPRAGLLQDTLGNLYGTTYGGGAADHGTVFRLSPPAPGTNAWSFRLLHSFASGTDGDQPWSRLIADAGGALYGTTYGGGKGGGTVFKLTPPAAGKTAWTETVIWRFEPGAGPMAGLIMDGGGALYGTTFQGGSNKLGKVYRLVPPSGSAGWIQQVLHNFAGKTDGANPATELLMDSSGALYGTALNGGAGSDGTAFQLTPPAAGSTKWGWKVIHSFAGGGDGASPRGTLLAGAQGVLYGTTSYGGTVGAGTVYTLTPPAAGKTAWTGQVLYSFKSGADGAQPLAGVIADAKGALYGTTEIGGTMGKGTVFKLTPPAAGAAAWTETRLHSFKAGSDGDTPTAPLTMGSNGVLYGTTGQGGDSGEQGTVFKLVP